MALRRGRVGGTLGLALALLAWPACEALRAGGRLPELGAPGRSRDLLCRIGAARGAVAAPDSLPGIAAVHASCACGEADGAPCHTVDVAGGDRRRSALLRPGQELRLSVPRGGARWLRFSAAALAPDATGGSVELELRASAATGEPVTWRERVAAGEPWVEAGLDLSPLAGRELELALRVTGDPAAAGAPWLALAMPRLVEPPSRLAWLPWRPRGANVLVYLIDTLRPDHMSLYGYARDTTPRMAELFAEGFVFERAYSTAAWTRPATASLLTSLYPSYHGANPDQSLPDEVVTLAERFREAGWTTVAFVANGNVYGEGLGFEQGFDRFLALQPAAGEPYVRAGEISRAVLDQLSRLEGEPFFAYVHSVDPHAPYGPPEAWRGHFADAAYRGPVVPHRARRKYLKGEEVAERDVAHIRDLYDEDIRYQDAMFGELMDALRERGLADGLVTVMTSDHGEELYDHGDWEHGKRVYEEQVRIPLAIHVSPTPRGRAGRRIAAPVQILDVMPTLLSWFSLPGLEDCQGESLGASIAGRSDRVSEPPERPIYCEELRERFDLFCYVEGPWKLAFKRHHPEWEKWGGPEQVTLYNLDADPGETRDRASEESERVERMLAAMFRVPARYADRFRAPGEREAPELDAATRAHLEALGYLD